MYNIDKKVTYRLEMTKYLTRVIYVTP